MTRLGKIIWGGGKLIWGAIVLIFVLLLWAGIFFAFGEAIFGVIEFGKLDLSLPSSFGDLFGGLFLATFLTIPIIFFLFVLVAVVGFVESGLRSGFPEVLGLLAISIVSGGLLVFLVPLWIAAVSVISGIGMGAWLAWPEPANDDTQ